MLHPITLQGTEPPEPAHRRPANTTPRRDDAGDMPREAGEVKVLLKSNLRSYLMSAT